VAQYVTVRRDQVLASARPVLESAKAHRLTTHAAAVAFRVLVALVPLVLLGIAMLGVLGLEDVWTDSVAPALQERLTSPAFVAVDYSADEIIAGPKLGLVTLALLLLLWETSRAVRAVTLALNEIHDVDEHRSWRRLTLLTLGLALLASSLVGASALVVVVAPRAADGALGALLSFARWPAAVLLLGFAVAMLLRHAPAEHPEPRWASAGSAVIVGGWLALSAGFGFWVTSVASYRSAAGTLVAFLVLTAYVLASSAVFLAGAELDEALRSRRRY
jgi:membrane protein